MRAASTAASTASAADTAHVLSMSVRRITLSDAQRKQAPSVQQPDEAHNERAASLSLLSSFVYPLSVDDFMRSCWQQKALHCQWKPEGEGDESDAAAAPAKASKSKGKPAHSKSNATPDRFAYVKRTHLHSLRVRALMENTASDSLFVWCRSKADGAAASASAAAPLASFELDASNPAHITAAETLHGAGSSLYFRAPPSMLSEYAGGMSRAVGFDFAGVEPASAATPSDPVPQPQPKGEIEVFLSRAGHVTDWHFDFMENFTLQLQGTKRWLIRRSTVTHPLRGATPHYADKSVEEQQEKIHTLSGDAGFSWNSRPATRADPSAAPACAAEEYDTVDLRAGDCFYHPAGIWHRVECSADSVSVNISLVGTDWASTVCEGIKQQLWKAEEWRSTVQCRGLQGARAQLARKLDTLRAAVSQLRAEDYLPPALLLPRRTHYVIRGESYDDESCKELCALACLEEQEGANGPAEATTAETKQRKKQKTTAAAAASSSSAAAAASSPAAASAASSAVSSPPLLLSALTPSTLFRVNPLALLLRFDHRKLAREAVARSQRLRVERRENGEEVSDEEEAEEEEAEEMSDAGSSASASASASAELPGSVGYVLHFSFGNESLESSVRVTVDVAAELAPCMERIRSLMMSAAAAPEKREESFRGEEAVVAGSDVENPAPTTASKQKRGRAAASGDSESAGSASRARTLLFFLCQQGALHVV